MTFYQELQLGQAGSKNLIRACETPRDRLLHTLIYLFKIALTVGFCFCFVTLYSMAFGSANSIVGVVVLLYLLVFRAADLCLHIGQSTALLASFLVLSAAAPHLAHLAGPLPGFFINLASIAFLILFGCHEPRMFNQSTLVLGYLLLYGYDVSGRDFTLRLAGIAFGALLVCTVFLCKHRSRSIPLRIRDIPVAFSLHHPRSRWQLCQIFCVPLVVLLAELAGLPRAMWAGIAAMSVILPAAEDMHYRVRRRVLGNIAGVLCFVILYFLLPPSIYAFIGVIGGIGVGLSAGCKYSDKQRQRARHRSRSLRTQGCAWSASASERIRRAVRTRFLSAVQPYARAFLCPCGKQLSLTAPPCIGMERFLCPFTFFLSFSVLFLAVRLG